MTALEGIDDRLKAIEKELKGIMQKVAVGDSNLATLLSLNEITADLRRRLSTIGQIEIALIQVLEQRLPGLAKQVVEVHKKKQNHLSAKDEAAIATLRSMLDNDQQT